MGRLRYLSGVATLRLDASLCSGCGLCRQVCPHGVFGYEPGKAVVQDRDACMECGACALNCPEKALAVTPGVGCAQAILNGWRKGEPPSCDCGGGSCC
jgi:ferredoxin